MTDAKLPRPQDRVLVAPVRRVTLLEDRAQVRRSGRIELPAGDHRLRIEGVSPVLADRSLVARVVGSGARVSEVRAVRRWIVEGEQAPRQAELETSGRELERQVAELRLEAEIQQRRRVLSQQAVGLTIDALNRELPLSDTFQARWEQDAELFFGEIRAANQELARLEREAASLRSQSAVRELHRGQQVGQQLATHVEIDLQCAEGGELELSLDYMVACALWRPVHRVRLEGALTHFECEAAVWQACGEDWEDVELSFSTARPTERAEPPVLQDDRLDVHRRRDKGVEVAVREEVVASTGEGQAEVKRELPGVDDGGETRLIEAAERATIPSTGRLSRVPAFAFTVDAEVDRICRPERSPLVHLRSKQVNTSLHPILAGPLELHRESGCVGQGEIGFVAPGELFLIGWGADDGVRVQRSLESAEDTALLTRKRTITRELTLHVSNLDALPASFRLEERIPVSEVEQVVVTLDTQATRPKAEADDQGIVGWELKVPAHGTEEVKLVYRLLASSDVRGVF